MFENIITNNEIKFNDLEKKIFKFVCMLGCLIIKIILGKQDKKILESIKGDKRKKVKGTIFFMKDICGFYLFILKTINLK